LGGSACFALRALTLKPLTLVRERDNRGSGPAPFGVGDDHGTPPAHDRHTRVRRAQIDAYDLTHVLSPSHGEHDYSVSTGLSSVEGEVLPPSWPACLGTSATVTIAGRKIRSCKRYPFSYSSTTIFPEA